jgi:hypothetical protein
MQLEFALWRYAPAVSPDGLQHSRRSAMAQRSALPISFIGAHETRRSVYIENVEPKDDCVWSVQQN